MKCVLQGIYVALVVLLEITYAYQGPKAFFGESPNSVEMPINDETLLTCKMHIKPDKFKWRHYPVEKDRAYNPNYHLVLGSSFKNLPSNMHRDDNTSSSLTIKSTNYSVAGDYQCLAYYGAAVVASVPGRISIVNLEEFPKQDSREVNVVKGNTIAWGCGSPISNPPASIDFYKDINRYQSHPTKADYFILEYVETDDSGIYKCKAFNAINRAKVASNSTLKLNVLERGPTMKPAFVVKPKELYSVKKGASVFIECAAYGNPVPTVEWKKKNGNLPEQRTKLVKGGLIIENVISTDEGTYMCRYSNSMGTLSHEMKLEYNEAPQVLKGPIIMNNRSEHIEEGEHVDFHCEATGTPKPAITWFLNGRNTKDDNRIDTKSDKLHFRPLEKRHAGIIQCFASNIVGTDSAMYSIEVIPKQISGSEVSATRSHTNIHKKRKNRQGLRKGQKGGSAEIVPPTKPNVTRNSDESVVVRWDVPMNEGLPIKFFKVQHRDMTAHNEGNSKSEWITENKIIEPYLKSFQVGGLKLNHSYKFRIAAVYSNDDNLNSLKSDTFHLTKSDFHVRNPLPIPIITSTEAVDSTSIKVFWDYEPTPNITINGFYVNYISSTNAGDYNKEIVDGEDARFYVIKHLDPGSSYDIKMQSFTTKSASEFSPIMHQKTASIVVETTTTTTTRKPEPDISSSSNLFIFIIAGILSAAALLTVITFLIICRKWKQKKNGNSGGGDKPEDLNHHIQVEGNDYVVSPKSLSRSNGCVITPNHITIRTNPLADDDNKNQNMIELSCLSSQNNNCSTQPSASTQETHPNGAEKVKTKSKKHKNKDSLPGENYV